MHGLGGGCDKEAISLIEKMPPWQPGKQSGHAVKVLFTLPITFKLTEDELKLPAKVYTYVEHMPKSSYNLGEYLNNNLKYPDSAQAAGIEGKVIVRFVVTEDGSIIDARVRRGIGGGCDEEALRVVKKMPKWRPGKQGGTPVATYFALPIVFALSDESAAKYVSRGPRASEDIQRYLKKNIEYPQEARAKGVQGRVIVAFTINEDGSASEATVVQGLGSGCDEEAVRLITHMPKWEPAMQDGKAVKVKNWRYPVEFKL